MLNTYMFVIVGDYAGFDEKQHTCNDNGKAAVIQLLKDTYGYQRLVHIGDGVTDLDACPPAVGSSSAYYSYAILVCTYSFL
jgi:phosphoserine phosphatase